MRYPHFLDARAQAHEFASVEAAIASRRQLQERINVQHKAFDLAPQFGPLPQSTEELMGTHRRGSGGVAVQRADCRLVEVLARSCKCCEAGAVGPAVNKVSMGGEQKDVEEDVVRQLGEVWPSARGFARGGGKRMGGCGVGGGGER